MKISTFILAGIVIVGFGIIVYLFFVPRCPKVCDDRDICTQDLCSKTTNYQCAFSFIPDCCGNKLCETKEAYETCSLDCPNCDDNNQCTKDSYDYYLQKCVNSPIIDVVCCGNSLCETEESYEKCAKDCPNCNDDNKCTKDSYDYHKQKCLNEIIIPCCGNKICDEGVERYSNCSADCPNCDDNNKLTTDNFNYKIQKCENILTHYFFDDFEEGIANWSYYDNIGEAVTGTWTTTKEGSNTVLRLLGSYNINLAEKGWDDYILKFKIKRIKGSYMNVNFRDSSFTGSYVGAYIVSLGGDGTNISLQKHLPSYQQPQDLTYVQKGFISGWHTFEIRGYKDTFNIYMDNQLLIKYKDSQNPIFSGKVSFAPGDEAEFLIDNVEVKILNEQDIIYP